MGNVTPIRPVKVERGTLIVLNDVDLTDSGMATLKTAIETACGHSQFVILRVFSSDGPVVTYAIDDLLAQCGQTVEDQNSDETK